MPSISHQTITSLFRDSPVLGRHLFEQVTGVFLADGMRLRLSSAQFTDLSPPEYSADAVYLIEGQDEKASGAVIIEIQLGRDAIKPRSWLQYVATLHRQLGAPVTLLVVTTSEEIARWCRRPHIYDHAGQQFTPLVIGPNAIPRITEIAQARALPHLAVLSAFIHGREPEAKQISLAACVALADIDSPDRARYYDFIFHHLNDVARKGLEAFMGSLSGYQYQTKFLRHAHTEGIDIGEERGRRTGMKSGMKYGMKRGMERGVIKGERKTLATQLTHKFGQLDDDVLERVENADELQLERWLKRVLTAQSLTEIFA